jgi:hypothetical protein
MADIVFRVRASLTLDWESLPENFKGHGHYFLWVPCGGRIRQLFDLRIGKARLDR